MKDFLEESTIKKRQNKNQTIFKITFMDSTHIKHISLRFISLYIVFISYILKILQFNICHFIRGVMIYPIVRFFRNLRLYFNRIFSIILP
jgi:hypothetical protein